MVDYDQWVQHNVDCDGFGLCQYYTGYMAMSFPELTRVCGHYEEPGGKQHSHFWCVSPQGAVVDPTAGQFVPDGEYLMTGAQARVDYEELVELVEDTPLFEGLEPWVQARCRLWLVLAENGRTDSRPGTGQDLEDLGCIRAPTFTIRGGQDA